MHVSGTLNNALTSIKNNDKSIADTNRPTLYFIDDEVLRGSNLRNDYEFPYLHEFMRLRSTNFHVWPQEISHLRPR